MGYILVYLYGEGYFKKDGWEGYSDILLNEKEIVGECMYVFYFCRICVMLYYVCCLEGYILNCI